MVEIYNPFESMTFTYDKCFMCGVDLDSDNRSDEHIYPKWLQHEFDLWNKHLILLNNSEIQYKNLFIPCCLNCNNIHLNLKIEKKVEEAVKGGYDSFIQLDESIIFKWLVKLSYGMLFKELSLKVDMRNPSSGSIVKPEHLQQFSLLFTFLQTIRFNTEFLINKPWSILIFKIKSSKNEKVYDAGDFILTSNYFMRLNDIGIISCLQDNGCQKEFFLMHMKEFLKVELHPIQFAELCAKFLYKTTLFNKKPFYMIKLPKNEDDIMQIISHDITGILFNEWKQEECAKYLEFFWKPWGMKYDEIYFDDEHMITFLYNEDHSIKIIDV